ncbi:MAG: phosphoribosyltransferase [Candidatus Aenigmatarchaeota archaeon]
MNGLVIGEEVESRMFILDDASPFGIDLPEDLISLLKRNNKLKILDAEKLAEDLYLLTEEVDEPVTVLGNGGALVMALLSRLGYRPDFNLVGIERRYGNSDGRTIIDFEITRSADPRQRLVDDVIASAGTINYAIRELGIDEPEALALLISGDRRSQFREEYGSTVRNVSGVTAARSVCWKSGYPAILSARFLLKKVRDDPGYGKYLSRYVNGQIDDVRAMVDRMDLGPFDLLYENPDGFIKQFGGSI